MKATPNTFHTLESALKFYDANKFEVVFHSKDKVSIGWPNNIDKRRIILVRKPTHSSGGYCESFYWQKLNKTPSDSSIITATLEYLDRKMSNISHYTCPQVGHTLRALKDVQEMIEELLE